MYTIKDKRKYVRYRVSFNTKSDLQVDQINFVAKQFYGFCTATALHDSYNRHDVIFKASSTAFKFISAMEMRRYSWGLSKIKVKPVEEFQPRKKVVAI